MDTNPVARLRTLAVEHAIDANHDQVASPQELSAAITDLVGRAVQEDRNADAVRRELQWSRPYPHPHYPGNYGRGGYYGNDGYPYDMHDSDWARYDMLLSQLRQHEGQAAMYRAHADELRTFLHASDGPTALMSDDFKVRFVRLQPEARSALVNADVRGNNDGSLTKKEYEDFNKRPFLGVLGKKRFEGHFGKATHNAVLDALKLPGAPGATGR